MAIDPAKPAATTTDPAAPPAPRPHARLEKWIWILIYAGLFAVTLGWYTGRADEATGWLLAVPGAIAAATGVVLIYVRSRMAG